MTLQDPLTGVEVNIDNFWSRRPVVEDALFDSFSSADKLSVFGRGSGRRAGKSFGNVYFQRSTFRSAVVPSKSKFVCGIGSLRCNTRKEEKITARSK